MKRFILILMVVLAVLAGAVAVNHYLNKRGERAAQANALVNADEQKAQAQDQILVNKDQELIKSKTTNVKLCVFIQQYYTTVKLPQLVKVPEECAKILEDKDCEITPENGSTASTIKGVCEEFAN